MWFIYKFVKGADFMKITTTGRKIDITAGLKGYIEKSEQFRCHLNHSLLLEEPNGLDATLQALILQGVKVFSIFIC